jgi:hypothetical protein
MFPKRCVRLAFATPLALLVLMISADAGAQQHAAATADQSVETLSEEVNDPTASLTQAQIKDAFTPAEYGTNAQPNSVQLKPILAVRPHGPMDLEQLVRPTLALVTIPQGKGASTRTEFGDTQLLDLLIMPWPDSRETRLRWGIGPYLVFPTATSHSAGKSAWQAGPAFAFKFGPIRRLIISALVQQATSFAYSTPNASPVTVITVQPLISYQLGRGWYIRSSDATWTFNLRHGSSTEIPLSAGIGKVWKFSDGGAINTSVSGEWTTYRQYSPQTEQFTVNFQITLLLPTVNL